MSGYEEEHNIPAYTTTTHPSRNTPHARPDLSTFFSALNTVSTDPATTNTPTQPLPRDVSAVFRLLANNYQIVLGETEGVVSGHETQDSGDVGENGTTATDEGGQTQGGGADQYQRHLEDMIEALMSQAEAPPKQVQGMPDAWFDESLERVPKSSLKPSDTCGLCFMPYLSDKYPLVVRLPCHEAHQFDLECIRPWLKLNTTCPFCRTDFTAKKKPVVVVKKGEEEDEEEFGGLYA